MLTQFGGRESFVGRKASGKDSLFAGALPTDQWPGITGRQPSPRALTSSEDNVADDRATGNALFDDDYEPSYEGHKAGLSPSAVAEIERRAAASRPIVLDELALVLRNRPAVPEITPAQWAVAAAFVEQSYTGIETAFEGWVREAGRILFDDEITLAVVTGAGKQVGQRRLRDAFAVTDEEAKRHDLRYLVSEKRRSQLRRAAEKPAVEQPAADPEPWVAEGISRATFYRRKNGAVKKVVRQTAVAAGDVYPGPAVAGVSLATWKRRRAAQSASVDGEPKSETFGDPTGKAMGCGHDGYGNLPFFLSSYSRVAESLTTRLTGASHFGDSAKPVIEPAGHPALAPVYPAVHRLPTAAGRRYAKQALDMGLCWSAHLADLSRPGTWFTHPEAGWLTADQDRELVEARQAAIDSVIAAENVKAARERTAAAAKAARLAARKPTHEDLIPEGIPNPTMKPARVIEAVWAKVPINLRHWVRDGLGAEFARLGSADAAVVASIPPAKRKLVLGDALVAAWPALTVDQLNAHVRAHWQLPTADGVAAALKVLRAPVVRVIPPEWHVDLKKLARIKAAILSMQPPIPVARHGLVEAAASAMLFRQKAFLEPEVVVGMFAHLTVRQWASQIENAWYREYIKDHPEQDPCIGTDYEHALGNARRQWANALEVHAATREAKEEEVELVIPMTRAESRAHEAAEWRRKAMETIEAELAAAEAAEAAAIAKATR